MTRLIVNPGPHCPANIVTRNLDIYARREAGETFTAIAKRYDLSSGCAAKIYHRYKRYAVSQSTIEENSILRMRLESFEGRLGPRLINGMLNAGAVTLGDVLQFTAREIMSIPNMGRVTLRELHQFLALYNLTLANDPPKTVALTEEVTCPRCHGSGKIHKRME